MAKRKREPTARQQSAARESTTSEVMESPVAEGGGMVEGLVGGFAEDLGKLLGKTQNKAETWIDQRAQIVKNLESIQTTAADLLNQLGYRAKRLVGRGRKRESPASNPAGGMKHDTRKTRTMSAEARARISAAQKARWAKVRGETRTRGKA